MAQLTLGTSAIREIDGLFSLNDLHAASGGEEKHSPNRFMRLDQTRALIAEIQLTPEMALATKTQHGGANPGTYACRELVIAYAAWISAAFHLKVIRVFLAQQAEPMPSIMSRRWLVEFDHVGREVIRPVAWNDCILKYEDLPKLLAAPDNLVASTLLADIAGACLQRLARRITPPVKATERAELSRMQ